MVLASSKPTWLKASTSKRRRRCVVWRRLKEHKAKTVDEVGRPGEKPLEEQEEEKLEGAVANGGIYHQSYQ